VNVQAKFEVCSFTHSWDNSGYFKKLGSPWLRPRSFFSKILMAFCSDGPCRCTGQMWSKVRIFTHSWDNNGYLKTSGSPWMRRSRSSKVNDFGTNRKRVCDFLSVRHSNLGPILHRFGDIAGFCAPEWPQSPHPYSTLILGVFPLHQIIHVGVSPRISLIGYSAVKLFSKNSNISRYLNVADRQTDRWTDGRTDRQKLPLQRGPGRRLRSPEKFRILCTSGLENRIKTVLQWNFMSTRSRAIAIAGRTARCRCKFLKVSNFTVASRGFHCDSTATKGVTLYVYC